MENEPIIAGGQGRNASSLENDAQIVVYCIVLACLILGLCSCGRSNKATFEDDCPSGDALPRPIRIQLHDCMLRAVIYAKAQGADMLNQDLPDLVVCKDEAEIIKATRGEHIPGKTLAGKCWYAKKTIFIVGDDHETLYHELGHWFFGTSEEIADNFSAYCMKKDAQMERGLTRIVNGNDKGE